MKKLLSITLAVCLALAVAQFPVIAATGDPLIGDNDAQYNPNWSNPDQTIVYGNANGDNTVDGRDVILLCQYLANYDYDTESSTVEIAAGANANGDNTVDGRDVILLCQYLANYDYDTGSSTVVLGPQQ